MVLVPVTNDTLAENVEALRLYIIAPNPDGSNVTYIQGGTNYGAIAASDITMAPTVFAVSAVVSAVSEAQGEMLFKVTRSADTTQAVTVDFSLSGTAVAGTDYTDPASHTVSFAAGQSTAYVAVALNNAGTGGALTMTLINPSGGEIGATNASTVTIFDSVAHTVTATAYALSAVTASENDEAMVVVVNRTGDTSAQTATTLTVDLTGTAGVGDYTNNIGAGLVVTFAQGETRKTISIPLLTDGVTDGAKTIKLKLDGGASTTYTIMDSDVAALVPGATTYTFSAVGGTSVLESISQQPVVLTRAGTNGGLAPAETTYIKSVNGTALAGSDYTAIPLQAVTWAAGEKTKVIMLTISPDALNEGAEFFTLNALGTDGTTVKSTFTVTIRDASPATGTAGNDTKTLTGQTATASDGDDTLIIGNTTMLSSSNVATLGNGNDTLRLDVVANAVSSSAAEASGHYDGGAGTDRIKVADSGKFDLSTGNITTGDTLTNFEVLDLSDVAAQHVQLRLYDVYAMTRNNSVPNTLSVTGWAGDVFELLDTGKVPSSPAAGSFISYMDYAGAIQTAMVEADTGGRAGANEVTLSDSNTYDVLQFTHEGQTLTVLVQSGVTTLLAGETLDSNFAQGTSGNDTLVTDATAPYLYTLAGNDTVTVNSGATLTANTRVSLESGNDVLALSSATPVDWAVAGAQYSGGSGMDSVRLTGANTATLNALTQTTANYQFANNNTLGFTSFEVLDMLTATTPQMATLNLANIANFTRNATVANTFRVTADTNGLDVLELFTQGVTLSTSATGTAFLDVDGTTVLTVGGDVAGLAGYNEVTVAGVTYDVMQYTYAGQSYNLLLSTKTNVSIYPSGATLQSSYIASTGNDVVTTTAADAGGFLATGLGADLLTLAVASTVDTRVFLGEGGDVLVVGSNAPVRAPNNLLNASAIYSGGVGVDSIRDNFSWANATSNTTYLDLAGLASTSGFSSFEVLDLGTTITTGQVAALSLSNIIDLTRDATYANTFRVSMDNNGLDVLQLFNNLSGVTLTTASVGTTIYDVSGVTNGNAVASTAGMAGFNDVTLGVVVYDVVQFSYNSQNYTLLVSTTGSVANYSSGSANPAYVGTTGVDSVTVGTTPGATAGGIITTAAGADTVNLGALSTSTTQVFQGVGNDLLVDTSGITNNNLLVTSGSAGSGAHYDGGAGYDTINLNAVDNTAYDLTTNINTFAGFESIDMSGANAQTLNLSLANVLELTQGNASGGIHTLKLMTNSGQGDVLNLHQLGASGTLTTPTVGSTLQAYNAAGVSAAYTVTGESGGLLGNEVTIDAVKYDVWQYTYSGQSEYLLISQNLASADVHTVL